jgi:cytochrome c oxidase subunit 2
MNGAVAYPLLASADGGGIDRLLLLVHGLMAVVFLFWLGVFVVALWRGRAGGPPRRPLPKVLVYGPAVLLLVAEVALEWGVSDPIFEARLDDTANTADAVQVRVVAQQFAWNFHYPGADGVFGRTRADLVDDVSNPIGLDQSDPAAADDITTVNLLYLPVNERALLWLTSRDVIHSFYVPEFRVKQDIIPGMRIPLSFTPTMTTAEFRALKGNETRTFEVACAQLCGQGHATMRGFAHILSAEEFAAWLVENAPDPDEDDFWDS